jgi:hypothetical protein
MRDSVPLRRVVLADDLWTRGRVGGVDFVLYVVPRAFLVVVFVFLVVVVVFLALFVFFVVFLVGRLRGGVFVLAGGDYLDAGRVLVGKVVVVFEGARVVIDCDSLPESDGHVSVTLDMIAALGRRNGHARRRGAVCCARLYSGAPRRRSMGHGATLGEMGYD